MLFLQAEIQQKKEKGQKGGASRKDFHHKIKKEEINNDFMYINYEI